MVAGLNSNEISIGAKLSDISIFYQLPNKYNCLTTVDDRTKFSELGNIKCSFYTNKPILVHPILAALRYSSVKRDDSDYRDFLFKILILLNQKMYYK